MKNKIDECYDIFKKINRFSCDYAFYRALLVSLMVKFPDVKEHIIKNYIGGE